MRFFHHKYIEFAIFAKNSEMDLSKTLTLDDSFKLTRRAFNTMVKPIGSACNLDCCYCYYLDKASLYHGREPKMSLDLLELYVKQYIEANDVPVVTFNWHGGEPLLMGLDFYKKAIDYERRYASGKKIENTIQTNATLITPEWANFTLVLARTRFSSCSLSFCSSLSASGSTPLR